MRHYSHLTPRMSTDDDEDVPVMTSVTRRKFKSDLLISSPKRFKNNFTMDVRRPKQFFQMPIPDVTKGVFMCFGCVLDNDC